MSDFSVISLISESKYGSKSARMATKKKKKIFLKFQENRPELGYGATFSDTLRENQSFKFSKNRTDVF